MKEKDNTAFIAKGIAIFSVVAAHCATVRADSSNSVQFVSLLLDNIGTFGIGLFFYYAGFFFKKSYKAFGKFFLGKTTTIFLPWIVCGTIVYLYVYIRKGDLNLYTWIEWIIGNGTYLYYLTVLTCLYFFLYFVKQKIFILGLCMLVSITCIGLTEHTDLLSWLNPYLNPMNFMIWFAMGLLVDFEHGYIGNVCRKSSIFIGIICLLLTSLATIYGIKLSYFKLMYIIFEIMFIWSVVGISGQIKSKILYSIGEISFSIYLLHMPFAGIITNITNRFDIWFVTLIRPIVVVAITSLTLQLICGMIKKYKIPYILLTVLGIRE